DDQDQPDVGATVARKFCGEPNVIAVIGNLASTVTGDTQPLYHNCGVAQITPSSSRDDLTTHGYSQFFRATARNSEQATDAAVYIQHHLPQIKRIAAVDANDSTTVSLATIFGAEAARRGAKVIDH